MGESKALVSLSHAQACLNYKPIFHVEKTVSFRDKVINFVRHNILATFSSFPVTTHWQERLVFTIVKSSLFYRKCVYNGKKIVNALAEREDLPHPYFRHALNF